MRLWGLLAVALVGCSVKVTADVDAADADVPDASEAGVDAGPPGCTGTEYVANCQRFWPGYTYGVAAACVAAGVDAGRAGCHLFNDDVMCCP